MGRTKRSIEFKLAVVQHFLSTTDGQRKTAARFGVDQSHVRQWANLYKLHGVQGFSATRYRYSAAEKQAILLYMREHRLSARQAAAHFNIQTVHTIVKWDRLYDEGGLEALHDKVRNHTPKPPRPKTVGTAHGDLPLDLSERDELEYLRAENAYLKKLRALIRQQQGLAQKSKRK